MMISAVQIGMVPALRRILSLTRFPLRGRARWTGRPSVGEGPQWSPGRSKRSELAACLPCYTCGGSRR